MKIGVKVGPIYLGGESVQVSTSGTSSGTGISSPNRIKYSVLGTGTIMGLGPCIGINLGRLSIWGSLFPVEELKTNPNYFGVSYSNSYTGTGYTLEANVRVWDRVIVGTYLNRHEFNKYSSDLYGSVVNSAELNPSLSTSTYGVNISYMLPFSDLKSVINLKK